MDFSLLRHKMVAEQLEPRDIHDPRVLEAMEWVPREVFVPPAFEHWAYEDRAVPIDFDQTVSQPYTVAFMCQAAQIAASDKVLEIGTGSGYCAAVLSLLAREVHTVERLKDLFQTARERLSQLGYSKVHVHYGDGSLGWPEQAPFDAIVVTAGAKALPPAYQEQLAEGGRIVMPIGPAAHQEMVRITRRDGQWQHEKLGHFGFVPLVSGKA